MTLPDGVALRKDSLALGTDGVPIGAGCGETGKVSVRPPSVVCGNGGLDDNRSIDTGGGAFVDGTPDTPFGADGVLDDVEPEA